MGDWPAPVDGQKMQTIQSITATADGAVNTKGAWQQVIAATTFPVNAIFFQRRSASANGAYEYLVDIGIGGAGSETVLIANIPYSRLTSYGLVTAPILFPIHIPLGSRLAVRCQCSLGGATIGTDTTLMSQGFLAGSPFSKITTYGANVADSGGTSIDPGGSSLTKGAYVQFSAATALPIKAIIVKPANQANAARQFSGFYIDVAIGGAGLEQVLIPDLIAVSDASPNYPGLLYISYPPIPVNIPAGSRLAARAAANTTDATDRLFDLVLFGVS